MDSCWVLGDGLCSSAGRVETYVGVRVRVLMVDGGGGMRG